MLLPWAQNKEVNKMDFSSKSDRNAQLMQHIISGGSSPTLSLNSTNLETKELTPGEKQALLQERRMMQKNNLRQAMKNVLTSSLNQTAQEINKKVDDAFQRIEKESSSCNQLLTSNMDGKGVEALSEILSLKNCKHVHEAVPSAVSSIGVSNTFFTY